MKGDHVAELRMLGGVGTLLTDAAGLGSPEALQGEIQVEHTVSLKRQDELPARPGKVSFLLPAHRVEETRLRSGQDQGLLNARPALWEPRSALCAWLSSCVFLLPAHLYPT